MLDFVADPSTAKTPQQILAYVEDQPLLYEPGTNGTYSNSNYLLLGLVIEEVAGDTVDHLIQARITGPLGLDHTFLDMTGEVRDDVARGYMDLNLVGQLFGVPPEVIAFIPEENHYEGSIVDCSYLFHPSLTWAAGALVSTAGDMARFMAALLGGDLLSPATLAEMEDIHDVVILGEPVAYGLGLQERPTGHGTAYGHGGLNFGYQAGTYDVRELGVTFSHMHNYLPEQSEGFQRDLLDLLANPPADPLVPCLPPDAFFHPLDGPYVHLRFKGVVNPSDAQEPAPGIANAQGVLADAKVPLYGYGSSARLAMLGLQTRVEIDSYSPSDADGYQMRLLLVSIAPTLFGKIGASGTYVLGPADATSVVTLVADLAVDAAMKPQRLCFNAVTDTTRESRVHVCDLDTFGGEAGQTLKLYGSLAVETDAAKVEAILQVLAIPPCLCWTGDTAGACP